MLFFAHRLVAHGIGGLTVQELSDTMTVDEIHRWSAYFSLEPMGEKRQDYRIAMLMSLQANMGRKKGRPKISVEKFLPKFVQKKIQSLRDMKLALQAQHVAMGGRLPETKLKD